MGDYPGVGVETGALSSNPLKRTLGLPFNEHGPTKWTGAPILGPEGRVRNDTDITPGGGMGGADAVRGSG
jgi:hypothetical protein